jgi:hypothetical protein
MVIDEACRVVVFTREPDPARASLTDKGEDDRENHPKYDANITPAIIENRGMIGRGHSRMPGREYYPRGPGEFESLSQWGTVTGRLVSS